MLCIIVLTQRGLRTLRLLSLRWRCSVDLWEKGPKYSLPHKQKHWLTSLALEAETDISMLLVSERDCFSYRVYDQLQKLKSRDKANPQRNHYSEHMTMRSIQTKLKENDGMITTADKGNSIVTLPTQQYNSKICLYWQEQIPDLHKKSHKTFSEPNQKNRKSLHYSHPEKIQMEIIIIIIGIQHNGNMSI